MDQRLLTVEHDFDQTARVVAGRPDALERVVAHGLLHPVDPDLAASRGIAFERAVFDAYGD